MLISLIFAAVAAGQPAAVPPQAAPADRPQATARQIVEQQFASRPKDAPATPPQSGAEASAVQAAYLKSIGQPLQPANSSFGSQDSSSSGGPGSR